MSRKLLLGLDIGGSKIEARLCEVIYDESGQYQFYNRTKELNSLNSLAVSRIPTQRDLGHDNVMSRLKELIKQVCVDANVELNDLSGIGIGLPGSVDPETGIMINGNSKIFIDQDIRKDIQSIFSIDIDIQIANDANCFALAESICGAGKEYFLETGVNYSGQIGLGIILGTGTGGGLIYKGDIFSGRDGGALEVGHSLLVTDGSPCYCGRAGCAEEYLSGPAIQSSHPDKLPSLEIFKRAEDGNDLELQIINTYKDHLVNFLTNLTNLYNPHFMVLGGGVSNQDTIYNGLEESIKENSFLKGKSPKIYKHQISDSAGVLGAIFLLKEKLNL